MKTYANKSNARRAAISAIAKGEKLTKEEVKDRADEFFTIKGETGEYYWHRLTEKVGVSVEKEVELKEERKQKQAADTSDDLDEPVIGHFIYCPSCKIHLSNGVIDNKQHFEEHPYNLRGNPKEVKQFLSEMVKNTTHEFYCMGCGAEFGEKLTLVMPEPTKPVPNEGTGLKIQKDRAERNGIRRPSEGGKCAAVWEFCDAYYAANGNSPMPKNMKKWAEDFNFNSNNAVIEMYQWRKFVGISK
jgi:hypothetical protein